MQAFVFKLNNMKGIKSKHLNSLSEKIDIKRYSKPVFFGNYNSNLTQVTVIVKKFLVILATYFSSPNVGEEVNLI